MPPAEAKQQLEQYRRGLRRRADAEYEQAALAYEQLAAGHKLLVLSDSINMWWLRHFGTPPENALLRRRSKAAKGVAHSRRDWWVERLDRGATICQLAEESGLTEPSTREKLRVLGGDLLARGYKNNLDAEKRRRRSA